MMFIKEKFSTEISAGSAVLISMVDTLARNVDHYITQLNNHNNIQVISNAITFYYQETPAAAADPATVALQYEQFRVRGFRGNSFCNNQRSNFRGRLSCRGFTSGRGRGSTNQQQPGQGDTVYCVLIHGVQEWQEHQLQAPYYHLY